MNPLPNFFNPFINLLFIYLHVYFLCVQLLIRYSFFKSVSHPVVQLVIQKLSHSNKLLSTDWDRSQGYKMDICPFPQGTHSLERETDVVNRYFTHGVENKIEASTGIVQRRRWLNQGMQEPGDSCWRTCP